MKFGKINIIIEPKSSKEWVFNCGRWLDKGEDDGQIIRELVPVINGVAASANVVKYRISVRTGDKRGAGTDANVFIILHGDKGDTGIANHSSVWLKSGYHMRFPTALRTVIITIYTEHTMPDPSFFVDQLGVCIYPPFLEMLRACHVECLYYLVQVNDRLRALETTLREPELTLLELRPSMLEN